MGVEEIIAAVGEKKLSNGETINELLRVGDLPLWWFLERFFVRHVLPAPINTFAAIKENRNLRHREKIKYQLSALFLRKYLLVNEGTKCFLARNSLDKNSFKETGFKENSFKEKPVPPDKAALFLTYSSHLDSENKIFRLQQIIEELRQNKAIEPLVICASQLSSTAVKYSASIKTSTSINSSAAVKSSTPANSSTAVKRTGYAHIYSFVDKEALRTAKEISKALHGQWRRIPIEDKKLLVTGNSGQQLCWWPHLRYAFDFFMSKEFLGLLILHYELFQRIILENNIKVAVITADNSLFEKCLIAAAQKKSIPVLRIQHGPGENVKPPNQLNHVYKLVFSKAVKKDLVLRGESADKIEVVGPVVFDGIFPFIGSRRTTELNILICGQATIQSGMMKKEEYFGKLEKILVQIRLIPSARFIIKLHPREIPTEQCLQNYKLLLKKINLPEARIFPGDISREQFYELIRDCRAFVHFGSVSAVEAMIIGRPVVTINLRDDRYVTHWLDKKQISVNVSHQGDIKTAVETALLDQPEMRKRVQGYLKEKCGMVDGRAYQRVAKLMERLTNS